MSFKTIFIVIVTAAVTYLFMLNFEIMDIKLVPGSGGPVLQVYKSIFLVSTALICFLAGYLGGRMGRRRKIKETVIVKEKQPEARRPLAAEDRDYIRDEKQSDRKQDGDWGKDRGI